MYLYAVPNFDKCPKLMKQEGRKEEPRGKDRPDSSIRIYLVGTMDGSPPGSTYWHYLFGNHVTECT